MDTLQKSFDKAMQELAASAGSEAERQQIPAEVPKRMENLLS